MIMVESERLVLYPIGDDELKILIDKETNNELKQAYGEMLQGCVDEPEHRIWYTVWFIELKSEPGTIVGDLSFKGLKPDGMIEIGYGLRDVFCGNGYMTEAVNEVLRYAFEELEVPTIYALTSSNNIGSATVQEKCGFSPFGEKIEVRWIDKSILTMIQRKITLEDYKARLMN